MKERVKVMQDMYENRSTNKKAAGCTVIISGEMKDVMDKIIAKHPEYKSYAQAFAGCLLYTSPSPRDRTRSRMPSSA